MQIPNKILDCNKLISSLIKNFIKINSTKSLTLKPKIKNTNNSVYHDDIMYKMNLLCRCIVLGVWGCSGNALPHHDDIPYNINLLCVRIVL